MGELAPVVVFAFNRPAHLSQCLTALAADSLAPQTKVYVMADGPRGEHDNAGVSAVRELISDPRWKQSFAEFELRCSSANRGLAASIIGGVTGILVDFDRVIVLEDDLVVADGFLKYMNDCLDLFTGAHGIASVSGYCPLAKIPDAYEYDLMAVPRMCSHGWGTWRDRWMSVDWERRDYSEIWTNRLLRARMTATGEDQLYRLRRQVTGVIRTWAILFQAWLILENKYTIYPRRNMVNNIGFDGSGTHTRAVDKMFSDIDTSVHGLRIHEVDPNETVIKAFHKVYSGGALGRLKRFLLNIFPPRIA
ncbi:glycosyltransferase family A protein [Luteimonas sp. MC1828]|uniref:glycosyltransferase family A protein n=1 Tax=Luteimonas sp. MC1828 TaxID=2799787 RepID=UPI0018F1F3DA|nr:glycosyltransferase family A protein [Luteimonas sp. MC1828]MBJ7574392.1 glycosyltransferase family 2 protein [Luteimonas sp. MC1828]